MEIAIETLTPQQALRLALCSVNQLVAACDQSNVFKRREVYATELLRRHAADITQALDHLPAENQLNWIISAGWRWIALVKTAKSDLGAPGDFGYDRPEGDAMRQLYNAADILFRVLNAAGGVA